MRNLARINLNILCKNACEIKSKLPKRTKLCAVVKADAYGHGAEKCASALYRYADCFAVALVEEGIALRLSGIDKDILVLTPPVVYDLPRAVRYGLTLTVCDVEGIKAISFECERQNRSCKVHIKFNSGMNRLGFDDVKSVRQAIGFIKENPLVILDGFYSHLGNPEDDRATKKAVDKFLLANKAVKGYNNKVTCHVSASGGFIKGYYCDMVRIGILLYGYKPFITDSVTVKPVMKIFSPVIAKRKIRAGEHCLYGDLTAEKETDVSLIRYGYADGFFRENTQGIFNNRCMDLTAEIGDKNGKWATVLSDAQKIADEYGTISYEILTKSAMRAEKIYVF